MPVRCAAAILIVLLLVGCESPKERIEERTVGLPTHMTDEQIITLCGAGHVSGGEAELAAELRRSGGKISAGFKNLFAARVLDNREGLQSSDIDAMYGRFLQCLDKRIDERKPGNALSLLPIKRSSILMLRRDSVADISNNGNRVSYSYNETALYSNTNKFPVSCSYKIYYHDSYRNEAAPSDTRAFAGDRLTVDDAKEIATWFQKSKLPEACIDFFRNGYYTFAFGYHPTESTEFNEVLEELNGESVNMIARCSILSGQTDLDSGYINFEAGETKELMFSGAENFLNPSDEMVVARWRHPVFVACWRA